MQTIFTLTIMLLAGFAACFFGLLGFLVVFVVGVVLQQTDISNRKKELERQELLATIRANNKVNM